MSTVCTLPTPSQSPQVDIYTAHYDPSRCFAETTTGAFKVIVAGSWFPRSLFGRCIALCAYIRCVLAALAVARHSNAAARPYDVVIADQVSAVVPLLRWMTSAKVCLVGVCPCFRIMYGCCCFMWGPYGGGSHTHIHPCFNTIAHVLATFLRYHT